MILFNSYLLYIHFYNRRNVCSTTSQRIIDIIPLTLHQDHPLTEMSKIWSIQAVIRNWVGFECRPSPKQLMMACMLLLEVARRCLQSVKINDMVEILSLWIQIADAKRPGGGGRLNAHTHGQGAKSCGHLLCMTP